MLDFTDSEHWAPFNSSQSTALAGVKGGGLSMYTSVMEMGYLSNMLTGFTVPGLETRLQ